MDSMATALIFITVLLLLNSDGVVSIINAFRQVRKSYKPEDFIPTRNVDKGE